MKIAVLSDIHGNLFALETVLADLKRERVDRIVCLGDIVFGGPQPLEVITRLRELGLSIVMGNTDAFFVHTPTPDPNDENDRRIMEMIGWAREKLTSDDLSFLKTFQPRIEMPLEGGKTLLCYHGSPESNTGLILATTPDNELAQALGDYRATVMAGGHTHTQMLRRFERVILINPGSVGMPFERGLAGAPDRRPPWGEYAILTSDKENLGIELRRVPLDIGAMIAQAHKSGMPHVEPWAALWSQLTPPG